MKSHWIVCTVVTLCVAVAAAMLAQTPADNPLAPYIPKNTKPYYLDLLMQKSAAAPGLTEENKAEWMQKHLAYIRSQVEAGKFVLVGPLLEENRLRGIAIIQAGSLEEAQRVANGDPLVQGGRLETEVHPIMLEDLSSVKFDYPNPK
ncbi:MAG TPA: YciI family protein [Terriglobales bacterium]|nr:YciI family protein [Terriglobales bacterium]